MRESAKTALANLEAAHGLFRVEDGKLYGPKGLSTEQRETVKEFKQEFIDLIKTRCGQCQAPLVITEHEKYIEYCCSLTPLHYCGWRRRYLDVPMDLFIDNPLDVAACIDCGWQGKTFAGQCEVCLGKYPERPNSVEEINK